MNSCELIAFLSSLSCTLYQTLSKEEVAEMAAILTQLSVTLSTMLANDEIRSGNLEEAVDEFIK